MRIRDVGLLHSDDKLAEPGYTLITPLRGRIVYLVGMRGEIVHQWQLPDRLGTLAYLLPGGNLPDLRHDDRRTADHRRQGRPSA